jgi:uncharacterized protein YuzE
MADRDRTLLLEVDKQEGAGCIMGTEAGGFPMKEGSKRNEKPPKIEYYAEQDILYFYATKGELSYSDEPLPGVHVKYDQKGRILAIEIFNASRRLWPLIEGVLRSWTEARGVKVS